MTKVKSKVDNTHLYTTYYLYFFIGFFPTGTYIEPLSMFLQISISRMQIAGYFENRDEATFDLSHSTYWSDHLEVFVNDVYQYIYENTCYLYACVDRVDSYFRVYKLNFCRDTYGKYFSPLNEPCYVYNGTSKGLHVSWLTADHYFFS